MNKKNKCAHEKTGLHIIGDFYKCNLSTFSGKSEIKTIQKLSPMIKKSGLHELGYYYHKFNGSGFTVVFALTESHLSIHTWPETRYVSLDIFVCNYSKDNSKNAINLYNRIKEIFNPQKVSKQIIKRRLV